jgi:hypothetical protein
VGFKKVKQIEAETSLRDLIRVIQNVDEQFIDFLQHFDIPTLILSQRGL